MCSPFLSFLTSRKLIYFWLEGERWRDVFIVGSYRPDLFDVLLRQRQLELFFLTAWAVWGDWSSFVKVIWWIRWECFFVFFFFENVLKSGVSCLFENHELYWSQLLAFLPCGLPRRTMVKWGFVYILHFYLRHGRMALFWISWWADGS